MSGNIKRNITAKYIADEYSDFFTKGEVYSGMYYPTDDNRKCIICYIDNEGEEYGISADHFEILKEDD